MELRPIFDPDEKGRPMRVAAFMSGSGTNIIKLIEKEKGLVEENGASPFNVVFLFSDRSDGECRGEEIALEYGIPYFSYDIRKFHQIRNIKRTALTPEGLSARKEFDRTAKRLIDAFDVDIIALGGYMSYTTLNGCVNVHPADLSIQSSDGKRKYVGDHAVRDAIVAGETTLRSSTLWTDQGVDTGPLLMVSGPVEVQLPESVDRLVKDRKELSAVVDRNQDRLKEAGDWKIFPRTIELISLGRFSLDKGFNVYLDQKPVPDGYRE